jgi:uncharacterized surface protein with fasciclin (FAS1) repeats
MKKIPLKQFAIVTFSAFTIYGCASSDQTADTAATEETMVSETTVAGGVAPDAEQKGLKVLVVEQQVAVPIATLAITALPMENTVEIDEMFEMDDTEKHDVLSLIRTSPNLSTFVKLLEQADLVDDIQRVGEVTIFAPTNEAFAKVPREKLETLLMPENRAQLSRMLQAHILSSQVSTPVLQDNDRIEVSEETYIPINTDIGGTVLRVGGAQVVKGNIEASNGLIHVMNGVILPSDDIEEKNPLLR